MSKQQAAKRLALANYGERRARNFLKRHFTNVRQLHGGKGAQCGTPFDYTGIDKLTGDRVAIEVKTIRRNTGKLVHIEEASMNRKRQFLAKTNRKGLVLVIMMVGGQTEAYFARLQNHISRGALLAAA